MAFADQSIRDFTDVLASKAPVPGGGGAAALVGAVGAALASMVGNLTVGKKKYADVEDDVQLILEALYCVIHQQTCSNLASGGIDIQVYRLVCL